MTTLDVVTALKRGKPGGLSSVAELRWCKPLVFAKIDPEIQIVANRYIKNRTSDGAGWSVLKNWLYKNPPEVT